MYCKRDWIEGLAIIIKFMDIFIMCIKAIAFIVMEKPVNFILIINIIIVIKFIITFVIKETFVNNIVIIIT